jgi:hypothetical protein
MIELTTAIALLVSSLYGPASVAVAQDVTNSDSTQSKTAVENPITLEAYVREYFIETPILAEIARCESTFRHIDKKTGQVLRGVVNKSDVGLLQVNEYYHGQKAGDLGFDLTTVDGNLAYAKYLYDKEGTKPWSASQKCWDK